MKDLPYTEYFKKAQEEKIATKILFRIIFVVAIFMIAFFSVNYCFEMKYSYITIGGRSMQGTLNPRPVQTIITSNGETYKEWVQDGVYIEETKDVDYGDIVILQKKKEEKTVIKRLIAFGGDYVSIVKVPLKDGNEEYRVIRMKANTSQIEVLQEDYVYNSSVWSNDGQMPQDQLTPTVVYDAKFDYSDYEYKLVYLPALQCQIKMFKVPENQLFFLGDNRSNSEDSRRNGTLSIDNLRGKVVEIVRNGSYYKGNDFYFFNRLGAYFKIIWQEILRFFGANV